MRTYQELFRTPEFRPLFLTSAGQVAAQTVSGLALSTLVYTATGSPLLSALAMFGPALAQVVGATTLLSAADRLPPRGTLVALSLLFALGTAATALPGLPVPAALGIVLGLGAVSALGGGVRYGLLNEVLSKEGYLLGRSALNMSVGIMQILGFATGGLLVALLSPRGALLTGAALYLATAGVARLGLSRRTPRATGRPSIGRTWRNNARLWSSPPHRTVYLALWVPNGLVVGCESLYVAYAPRHAGILFAAGAAGMLAGDVLIGRFVPRRLRRRLAVPLLLLLAVPHLVFFLGPSLPLAVAAVTLATVGYAASLVSQERLMALTPDELSGHALGLHSSGMLTTQGVCAVLAGAVAERTSPGTGITVLAAASVAVTLLLARRLREVPEGPEGPGTPGPGTEEPGTEERGTAERGTEERGTEERGTAGPGTRGPDARGAVARTRTGDAVTPWPGGTAGTNTA
ncbi:MFS transporter [Streptomyces sp. NBC_01498]|uniref:MFS transporter n=1 Tax=Streptomyces sp. NBC_01498 TaxID=2975870 RepID=UPI002E7C2A4D|nr:MFS transporter [Streptomyces sp. NBC_01498]WTL25801.1 MFS transporter [Streptomyces sp. NBC_01498]